MAARSSRGFTLAEVLLALGITALITLSLLGLTSTIERVNRAANDRVEAEHSGQATLEFILRELQTATAFYLQQAQTDSIGYRTTVNGVPYYWRLFVGEDQRLKRRRYTDNTFTTEMDTEDISDGINNLRFRYYARTATGIEEIIPGPDSAPLMFYMIQVDFTVTVRNARVHLGSAVSTLNITGMGIDTDGDGTLDEVI